MSEENIRIKMKKNVWVAGKKALAGKTITASKKDAKYLITSGAAIPFDSKMPEVEDREQDIQVSEKSSKK